LAILEIIFSSIRFLFNVFCSFADRSPVVGLQEKLTLLRKGFEAQAPKKVVEIMHRATKDLEKSGILDGTVNVGDKAPDFSLKNADGEEFRLHELLTRGPVVLTFYRGKW
jgi:hypothetical protein